MSLIIEDGSIVPGANSYVTAIQYQTWANARFGASRATVPADDAAAEVLIHRAMDYFESLPFNGEKLTKAQPLQFPRYGMIIDSFYVETNEIPSEVISSIYELTYAQESGEGLMNVVDRATKIEKVGALEIEYMDNASARSSNPSVMVYLRKLIRSPSKVVRI